MTATVYERNNCVVDVVVAGSFSNDDDDGNDNVEKQVVL